MREAYRHVKPAIYEELRNNSVQLLMLAIAQKPIEETAVKELEEIILKVFHRFRNAGAQK